MSDDVARRAEAWNSAVSGAGGHLLQSWEWGEFKARHGWRVDRVTVDEGGDFAAAQILVRSRGPVSLAYVPRGPVMRCDASGNALFAALRARIDLVARTNRALTLLVEPDASLPLRGTFRDVGFVRGPGHLQPGRTVRVPIDLDDDALLSQMHQKNRYSVRLAGKRGVVVERMPVTDETIDVFYAMLTETAGRNRFGVHSRTYYEDFLRLFRDRALMTFARVGGNVAAAVIAARFGREACYMYGASSTTHRADGAAFALQYDAMRWARDQGSTRYDLWGIPTAAELQPLSEGATGASASNGDDMRGLYTFKTRFGGEIVAYPPMMERRYVPVVSALAGRLAFRHA